MITYSESESKEMCLCAYLTDLHAVEKYLLGAIENQLSVPDLGRFPDAESALARTAAALRVHLQRLEARIEHHQAVSRATVKDTMTAVAGFALGLVSKAREQHIAKMLRDDITVLTLVALGYSMLHTAALAVGQAEEAAQAADHLRELTPLIGEMNRIAPETVAQELKLSGFLIDPAAAAMARETIGRAWNCETAAA